LESMTGTAAGTIVAMSPRVVGAAAGWMSAPEASPLAPGSTGLSWNCKLFFSKELREA
jgi:hypothetical protein